MIKKYYSSKKTLCLVLLAGVILCTKMDLEAEPNNSKLIERPLLCYMVGNKSGWTIEDCERLGIFDVFNIFGISSSVPDLSGNTIVKKAEKEGKVFLACVGLPFNGTTEDEIRRKLLNHLEAPFRKEFPWDKQNIDFYGIEIDEVVDGFKNTDKDGKRNMNIDILYEVLKQFKIDYPDKKIFIWGVSRCQNEDSRLFKEVVSPLVDFPQPFGPTTAVIPGSKLSVVLSQNDLKPTSSSLLKYIFISSNVVATAVLQANHQFYLF